MNFIFDRLYGKISFPKIIRDLLDCPGLLRLREIGMGNIRFINFPSFSAVTRYEHSLGTCHLADIASKSLGLSKKDRIELMMAALYHDVTTPPFAHATEEILKRYFEFNHEKHLYKLMTAQTNDLEGQYVQIYHGRMLKLPMICHKSQARKIGIDLYRILELILGKKEHPLSSLINSDIDLDNIDNVFRAASAMGVEGASGHLAEKLAKSFCFREDQKIAFFTDAEPYLRRWKELREIVYDMIFCSIDDFSLQTMLKHALICLIESGQLQEVDWKLTEEDVLRKIKEHPDTREIYERMMLKKLYDCLGVVWIKGPGVLEYVENINNQQKIEEIGKEVYGVQVILNYYIDKRQRYIQKSFLDIFSKETYRLNEQSPRENALLMGFFTPDNAKVSYLRRKKREKKNRQKKEFLHKLREEIPSNLSLYSVKIINGKYPKINIGELIT